jgi:hypothetical protein
MCVGVIQEKKLVGMYFFRDTWVSKQGLNQEKTCEYFSAMIDPPTGAHAGYIRLSC